MSAHTSLSSAHTSHTLWWRQGKIKHTSSVTSSVTSRPKSGPTAAIDLTFLVSRDRPYIPCRSEDANVCLCPWYWRPLSPRPEQHIHARTHARTPARARTHTHTHKHTRGKRDQLLYFSCKRWRSWRMTVREYSSLRQSFTVSRQSTSPVNFN